MQKKYLLFLILSFFLFKTNAQFVGYYKLHDGGVDMPSSSLAVLDSNKFYFFYYAGYKSGTWRETDKNTIELTELKADSEPLKIYAKGGKFAKELNINVINLSSSYALIGFSKDSTGPQEMKPVFNRGVNCLSDHYMIKKNKNDYNYMTITIPAAPNFGQGKTEYPYKALNYTFPLDKKYSVYTVIPNPDVLERQLILTLEKKNGKFRINDSKNLEREDLTAEMLTKISNVKKIIGGGRDNRDLGELVASISRSNSNIDKWKLESYFTKYCPGDEPENITKSKNPEPLTSVERPNGIYEILNYKEYDYDISKYELRKQPSLAKEDFADVKKIFPDYGGTELQIIFTKAGALKFAALSRKNINKPIAIVLNKLIVAAPLIQSEISGGKVNIAGKFSEKEIDELIEELKH